MREVDAFNSSRECTACGAVDAQSRKGLRFLCVGCGHEDHADVNAAKVILKRGGGTALLPVEASGCRADEAGTRRRVA
jgi:putative transposase